MDETARRIGERVRAFIRDPAADAFEPLACTIFAYQYERCAPYRAFCDRRGVKPARVERWIDVPPIPAEAFAEVDLAAAPPVLTFRTSGTTRSESPRGAHLVADPSLYEEGLLAAFRFFVLPDRRRIRLLSLVPERAEQPESSLSYMACTLLRAVGDDESRTYTRDRRALLGALFAALQRASAENEPVLLFGTSLAFVPVLAAAREAGFRCVLPRGSRLVDTGGTKGARDAYDETALVRAYEETFGLPAWACVNEYGMTELLSQLYNDDLRYALVDESAVERGRPPDVRRDRKQAPHWLRARILDPDTLEDAAEGVLAYYDLANCHSALAVLTADLGTRVESGGFVLRGRRAGAASRGCSIAMDEWLG